MGDIALFVAYQNIKKSYNSMEGTMGEVIDFVAYKANKAGATYAVYDVCDNTIEHKTFMTDDALIAFLYDAGIIGHEIDDYIGDD